MDRRHRLEFLWGAVLLASPLFAVAATTDSWLNAVSGQWTDASQWSAGVVPINNSPLGSTYDVFIGANSTSYTITLGASTVINNMTLNTSSATLYLFNGSGGLTLTVNGILNLQSGTLNLGSILTGGTITGNGGSIQRLFDPYSIGYNSGPTFNHVILGSGASLHVTDSTVINGLTINSGNATLEGRMTISGTQSFTGSGTLSFAQGYFVISSGTLTIDPNVSLSGSSTLALDQGSKEFSFSGMGLVNNGIIQTTNPTLFIQTDTFTNSGTIQITNGSFASIGKFNGQWHSTGKIILDSTSFLGLSGAFTTDDFNTIGFGGGTLTLAGSLDNSNHVLQVSASTGSIKIDGGTISGGTITTSNGASLVGGTTLDRVVLGPGTAPAVVISSAFTISNTLTLANATINVNGTAFSTMWVPILAAQSSPFAGTGTLLFNGAGRLTTTTTDLTLSAGLAIRTGARIAETNPDGIFTATGSLNSYALVSAETPNANLTLEGAHVQNFGVIQAINGGMVTIRGALINNGTINNSGGIIAFTDPAFSPAFLTAFQNQGIVAISRTSYNNSNGVFALSSATGEFGLTDGSTFTGGTITSSDHTRIHIVQAVNYLQTGVQPYSTVNGITLATDMLIHTGATLRVASSLTLAGATITLGGTNENSGGFGGILNCLANAPILGNGGIVFNSPAAQLVPDTGKTLTLAPGITTSSGLTGGFIGNIPFNSGFGSSTTTNITVLNQGTILSQTAGKTIGIYADKTVNQGSILATSGAGITMTGTWSNSGIISAANANVTFGGSFTNTGSINLANSTLTLWTYNPSQVLGNFSNAGRTILAAGVSNAPATLDLSNTLYGPVDLGSCSLIGITLTASSTSPVVLSGSMATLDVTLATNLTLLAGCSVNSTSDLMTLNNSTITLLSSGTASTTLAGKFLGSGAIVFDGPASNALLRNLQIGAGVVVRTGIAGGNIGFSPINNGTISSETAGQTLTLSAGPFTNNATLQVKNGGLLKLDTSVFNAGSISLADVAVVMPNTDSSSTTLNFSNNAMLILNNSSLNIQSGWSNGGTISLTGSTLTVGGTPAKQGTYIGSNSLFQFNNVTFTSAVGLPLSNGIMAMSGGAIDLGTPAPAGTLALGTGGTLKLTGTQLRNMTLLTGPGSLIISGSSSTSSFLSVTMNGATVDLQSSTLAFSIGTTNVGTATGSATIILDGPSSANHLSGARTLTLAPGILVRTGTSGGSIGTGNLTFTTLINQGTISAQTLAQDIAISVATSSSGTFEAINGATLHLNRMTNNSGLIHAGAGSSAFVTAATSSGFVNSGILRADGGALSFVSGNSTLGGTIDASAGGALAFNAGSVTLTSPISLTSASVNFNANSQSAVMITGTGTVVIGAAKTLTSDGVTASTLQINGSQVIRANGSMTGISKVNALSIAGTSSLWTGKLDITNNAFIVEASDSNDRQNKLLTLASQIDSGTNNGLFNGNGITSAAAAADPAHLGVGLFDNSVLSRTDFGGGTGNVDGNSILMTAALLGDANLDSVVGLQDLNIITSHWHQAATNWAQGDLNLDGTVDSLDVAIVVSHWNQPGGYTALLNYNSPFGYEIVTVPESGSLMIAIVGALPLFYRKRGQARRTSF